MADMTSLVRSLEADVTVVNVPGHVEVHPASRMLSLLVGSGRSSWPLRRQVSSLTRRAFASWIGQPADRGKARNTRNA
jgi:hypothetical protein